MGAARAAPLPGTGRVGVLLTPEPTGTVATRFAGVVDFRATLSWDSAQRRVPCCLPPAGASIRYDLDLLPSPCGRRVEVVGSVRALSKEDMSRALDRALRAVGDAAAVSGAVLEMRAVKRAAPCPADPTLAQRLATDLWTAGFGARFAPCWEPAWDGALAVGAGQGDPALAEFLGRHQTWWPTWRAWIAPPVPVSL